LPSVPDAFSSLERHHLANDQASAELPAAAGVHHRFDQKLPGAKPVPSQEPQRQDGALSSLVVRTTTACITSRTGRRLLDLFNFVSGRI
jgi:hypothetical protein